jgi:chaperonin GroEL
VAIKSPSYGANRTKMLNDIATLCGGAVVCDETGVKLESATAGSMILGSAKRIVCNKENTAIIDGLGDQAKIEELVTSLRAQIENEKADYERDNLKERLAKLTSGIGIISVGGTTEAEMKDKRDLVDDAFCASKAALKSGVVAGGGAALLEAKQHLDSFAFEADVNDDYMNGFKIFTSALDAPVKKLLENAGIQNSASLIDKVIEKNAGKIIYGYDILSHEIVDMLESKIFDPTDVILNEIKNASSIAGLLLTTDCLICEEDAKPQMAACPSQMA